MSNHYHLMVETPEANLVAGMRWLQNTYTRRHNCRHRLWGRLFGDRYKAILSEGGSDYYYCSLMDYIHLNPVRAGLVRMKRGESVRDYLWSSVAKGYAVAPSRRPIWLAAEEGLPWRNVQTPRRADVVSWSIWITARGRKEFGPA